MCTIVKLGLNWYVVNPSGQTITHCAYGTAWNATLAAEAADARYALWAQR